LNRFNSGNLNQWVNGTGSVTQVNPTIISNANINYFYSAFGKTLFLNFTYHSNTAGTAGSGIYYYKIPIPTLVDSTFYSTQCIFDFNPYGVGFTPNSTFNDYANRLRGIRVGSGLCENMGSNNSATSVFLVRESAYTGDFVLLVYAHSFGYQSSGVYGYNLANVSYSWTAEIALK
jgi:hypothetical protein